MIKAPVGDVTKTLGMSFHGLLKDRVYCYIDRFQGIPSFYISCTLKAPDSTDEVQHENHKVTTRIGIPYSCAETFTRADWIREVERVLKMAILHELDEGVKVDGIYLHDPHPPEKL